MGEEVYCYNKGCGKKFIVSENQEDSCQHHPGGPIFHDALKGWSCCKKRSTDFSEFLAIPGCTRGLHSNVKPEPQEKQESKKTDKEVVVVEAPKFPVPKPIEDRPVCDDPLKNLKITVGDSLKRALEKQMQDLQIQKKDADTTENQKTVAVGTSCKNSACKCSYQGKDSDLETCVYHPGFPVFHEGMKYWSCCQKKTTDFDNFLDQEGCETGDHLWIKPENPAVKKSCRFDWHQTGKQVVISIFSKVSLPDKSYVKANKLHCDIHIEFEEGKSVFEQKFDLWNEINTDQSQVKMLGTKVEICLQKNEAFSWPSLELKKEKVDN